MNEIKSENKDSIYLVINFFQKNFLKIIIFIFLGAVTGIYFNNQLRTTKDDKIYFKGDMEVEFKKFLNNKTIDINYFLKGLVRKEINEFKVIEDYKDFYIKKLFYLFSNKLYEEEFNDKFNLDSNFIIEENNNFFIEMKKNVGLTDDIFLIVSHYNTNEKYLKENILNYTQFYIEKLYLEIDENIINNLSILNKYFDSINYKIDFLEDRNPSVENYTSEKFRIAKIKTQIEILQKIFKNPDLFIYSSENIKISNKLFEIKIIEIALYSRWYLPIAGGLIGLLIIIIYTFAIKYTRRLQ